MSVSDDVRSLLDSGAVTPVTRRVLRARLAGAPGLGADGGPPRMLSPETFGTLEALCARLLALGAGTAPSARWVAAAIDHRLAEGTGDGWRYATLPDDRAAYQRGLAALDVASQAAYGAPFAAIDADAADAVLTEASAGRPAEVWEPLGDPARWLEEVLAEATECVYAHPAALSEIGYAGFADAPGWPRVGLGAREPREPALPGEVDSTADRASATSADLRPAPLAGDYDGDDGGSATDEVRPSGPPAWIPAMQRHAPDEEVDAVVVGTGAGGAPLLARLAAAGLRVVALEAGEWWDPARDFATDERAQSPLFWNDERISAGQDPIAFGRNNSGTGVGGSTLHYTAYVPRPHPDDFHLRTTFGVGEDWPFGYDALAPYYAEVERVLGVSGPASYPWGPARLAYPLPPLPLNAAAELMQRGAGVLGLRTSPAPNAAPSAPYSYPGLPERPACTNRGFCQAGCSVGAKGSADVTWIPLAVRAGAEVRTGCRVTKIETRDGQVTDVIYRRDDGHGGTVDERQRCRALVLSAGAIETPRLLLMNQLALDSGQVGRNLMAHMGLQVWGTFDTPTRPFKGIPGGLISEDTHRPPDADFAGGYLLQSIGVMPVTYASQVARGRAFTGDALRAHLRRYGYVAGINMLGDCLPSAENYVELSDEEDARGLPKPRAHFNIGENDGRMVAHGERVMRDLWTAAGAHDLWSYPRSAHVIGTCRMGADAGASVVDGDGRSHDVPNLWISDNSTFPSALAANPALTIMAVALRTADRLVTQLR